MSTKNVRTVAHRRSDLDMRAIYWRAFQQGSVESVCASPTTQTRVAEVEAVIVGFVAISIHEDGRIGEIDMLAVDPE